MKRQIRMIFPTGNNQKGFTFIEVMVTLVVLSSGIVFIYRSFFLCADYLTRLSLRLDANQVLDNKISDIKCYVKDSHDLSFSRSGILSVLEFNHKQVQFFYQIDLVAVLGMEKLYRLDVRLSWEEHGVQRHLNRMSMLEVG